MSKRCVVTGVGVVSPVGNGKEAFWKSLIEGKSGVSRITRFDTSKIPVTVAGEVKNFDPLEYVDESRLFMTGRYVQFGVAAAKMAVADAGISAVNGQDPRMSLFVGTTSPAVDSIEEHVSYVLENSSAPHTRPYALTAVSPHLPAAEITHALGGFDHSTTISTVCTSGLNAVGAGMREIYTGRKAVVLAGATESTVSFFTFLAYIAAGMLAADSEIPPQKIMRPYDKTRSSGVLAEGAAFLVLEELDHARMRGARIYGELSGFAYKNKHLGPNSAKQTMINAIRGALESARMSPAEVDYISANGVSTQILDKMETLALKEVFGDYAYRLPVSAIKSMLGIPNSSVGPMQLIASLLSFETDIIPPTINYEIPDPECDLDYVPNVARINRANAALVNNLGMDGGVAVLIAKRYGG